MNGLALQAILGFPDALLQCLELATLDHHLLLPVDRSESKESVVKDGNGQSLAQLVITYFWSMLKERSLTSLSSEKALSNAVENACAMVLPTVNHSAPPCQRSFRGILTTEDEPGASIPCPYRT